MGTSEYTLHEPDELGDRLRTYRIRRGMTQRALADELGVTQQSVARWEQGSPPRRYLLRVIESMLEDRPVGEPTDPPEPAGLAGLADIIGIRPPDRPVATPRSLEGDRRVYVQGCLKLLERGERLPNRVLLLLADELGWRAEED